MNRIEFGDCRDTMRRWAAEGVKAQTCVTSPPYFGLRSYGGGDAELGKEATPEQYVAAMVEVFRCVWDVLADDGTLWLNIGDSYARTGGTDRKVSSTAQVGSTRVPGKTNGNMKAVGNGETRNRRSVWTVATFPPALIEPCILAGSRVNDIVLDPFMGSGTTAAVALQHGRQYLGCELNPAYQPLQDARVENVFAELYA